MVWKQNSKRVKCVRRLLGMLMILGTVSGSIHGTYAAASDFDASAYYDDRSTVSADSGIRFRLFNYADGNDFNINMTEPVSRGQNGKVKYHWRTNAPIFRFFGSAGAAPDRDDPYDMPDFEKNHATVERTLTEGYPVQELSRDATGAIRPVPGQDQKKYTRQVRNLAYLFGGKDPYGTVTAYDPANTILQVNERGQYYYDSALNAVDYDIYNNVFRVRNYIERNSATAEHYGVSDSGDFLPFTYTGGEVIGVNPSTGEQYHVQERDTKFWFGMEMEVDFFMPEDGKLNGQDMVFQFAGDDDVWVFVDDVLVLDLGGTHGKTEGSINFSTGQVLQYLNWKGTNTTEQEKLYGSDTSFPTTLKNCYSQAGRQPNGGWSKKSSERFESYTRHKLKFFYLERGGAVSNCKMYFNLPTLPANTLTVGKSLAPMQLPEETREYLTSTLDYSFRIWKANPDGSRSGELLTPEGTPYHLYSAAASGGQLGSVGKEGIFTLKADQRVRFDKLRQLAGNAPGYIVEELIPSDLRGQYGDIEYNVNGTETGNIQRGQSTKDGYDSFFSKPIFFEGENRAPIVMFTNRVDTTQLSCLQVTKKVEPGSSFAPGQLFPIQVTLGKQLLPVGSEYRVGEEVRTVETAGMLMLADGETATVGKGILSGTTYRVSEVTDGWNAAYSGEVTHSDGKAFPIDPAKDVIEGEFPLRSVVHITVHNSTYDFSCRIPFSKTLIGDPSDTEREFFFRLMDDAGTELPGGSVTVQGTGTVQGELIIGFDSGAAPGIYSYTMEEIPQNGDGIVYDPAVYRVTVAVADGESKTAAIQSVTKDGAVVDSIDYVNYQAVPLKLSKRVTGNAGSYTRKFSFTAAITLDGRLWKTQSLELSHGESILLEQIPYGAAVTITETNPGSYETKVFAQGTEVTTGANNGFQAVTGPLTEAAEVIYVNHLSQSLDTGVDLDYLPYIAIILVTLTGLCIFMLRKYKKIRDEE